MTFHVEQVAVLAQPAAAHVEVWAGLRDEPPEVPRVIQAPQVHEFVNDDVVTHSIGHENEPPVEADVS